MTIHKELTGDTGNYYSCMLPNLADMKIKTLSGSLSLNQVYNQNFVIKQIRRAADIPRQLTSQTKDVNKPK